MKPTLYLMMGYPGAGKTTVSQTLHDLTGVEHLWADQVRKRRFTAPTYTKAENIELYDVINLETAKLLAEGKSVIFDTSFNLYEDRQKLRQIATDNHAKTLLLWVKAPLEIAKLRAVSEAHKHDSRVLGGMSEANFDRLTSSLEPPRPDENAIIVDGTKVTPDYLSSLLFNK